MEVRQTTTRKDLLEFHKKYGLRKDWHEPDEQGISARVTGTHLDNAMGENVQGEELTVILYIQSEEGGLSEGIRINLANLLAMATTSWVRSSNPYRVEVIEEDEIMGSD